MPDSPESLNAHAGRLASSHRPGGAWLRGGLKSATRRMSRWIASPFSGPRAYAQAGASQSSLPRLTASAPAQKYSRQSSKLRMPPVAMIGRSTPAWRSSATTRSPSGLMARPERLPKPFFSSGPACFGIKPKRLQSIDRGERCHVIPLGQARVLHVLVVGRELQDQRMRLSATAWRITSSTIVLNGKFTLWQETLTPPRRSVPAPHAG